ncbi:ubiquitin-like domain-containing ctd [Lynx pardinus]|uniref:Ubiquitin-like domain-containing ctd n=1 Tax=Lynx pardinus TaxID=191816 RepID=A0A485MJ48_LYNPA|nr:ubiquitin-like domain-containing ctd [Lynx pardinus]
MALPIIVKWGGQEYSVTTLSEDDTVLDLKQFLKTLTGVLPERQKLLGLKVKGKPAENDVKLGALKLKPNTKIMMMGTREESLEDVLGPPPDNDDVVNDFDIEDEVVEVENREENLLKISRRVKEYKVEILNPPREGKKLLVLDVDYTLFAATNMKWIEAKMKIRPFMKAHLNRDKDKELLKLTQYLKEIAKLDDFLDLNHKYWERYLSKKQGQ